MLLIKFFDFFIYADKQGMLATKRGMPVKVSSEVEQKVKELLEVLIKPETKKPYLFKINKKYKPLLQGLMDFEEDTVIYDGVKGFFTDKGIVFDTQIDEQKIFDWLLENYNINLKKERT